MAFADLEHRRHGQLRPGERHGLLVLGEVLQMATEARDEVAVVETEGESPRPVPAAQLRDTPGARAVPLRQKADRRMPVHRLVLSHLYRIYPNALNQCPRQR